METGLATKQVGEQAELQFNALRNEVVKAAAECNAIVITDDLSLQMATQKLSVAGNWVKTIADKHKNLKDPFWTICKQLDGLKNTMTDLIQPSIDAGKVKIKAYNDIAAEKKRLELAAIEKQRQDAENARIAEENRKLKIQQNIQAIEVQLSGKIAACNTPEECNTLADSIESKFPPLDTFAEYSKLAVECKTKALNSLGERHTFLKEQETLNAGQKQLAQQQEQIRLQKEELDRKNREIEAEKLRIENERIAKEKADADEILRLQREAELENQKQKNMRSNWKGNVIDFSQVPDRFKEINQKAINEYIKENKSSFVEGYILHGIQFTIETTVVNR